MKKSTRVLDEIQHLHQAGKLEEAKNQYIALLTEDSDHIIPILQGLGAICAEQKDWEAAQMYFKQLIAVDPSNPVHYIHLGNVLKERRLFSEAEEVLLTVISNHPHFAPAYQFLGNVYFAQKNWLEAKKCYQFAIDIQPDYLDAYYNLGLTAIKLMHFREAITIFQSLLQLSPRHQGGLFQLGSLTMQLRDYYEAIDYFAVLAQINPFQFETWVNLASCYLKVGDLDQAKSFYLEAQKILPNDKQVLFNLGVIAMQQGKIGEAIHFYSDLITYFPDFYDAHHNLGVAYHTLRNKNKALLHFQKALEIKPDNPSLKHIIEILSEDKAISSSPTEYIQSLFDHYADHYDKHVMQLLHYRVPNLLYQLMNEVYPNLTSVKWDILDLGCGTGLCGQIFKPIADSLSGVDISPKMLAIAAKKKIYDALTATELSTYLENKNAAYDLIIGGDVIVYTGELAPLFALVSQALKENGYFAFNTEITHEKDYLITPSGRFAHNESYIRQLAQQYQLIVVQSRRATLRAQKGEEVLGNLFVLQKTRHLP